MKCIICDTDHNCSLFMKECSRHPTYWKCEKCELVFAYPQRISNYSAGSNHEDYYLSDKALSTRVANYARRSELFENYLSHSNPKLLDIGAFNGAFLHHMQSKGVEGVGIEPDVHASEYGRNEFNVDIITGTLEMMEDTKTYDVVTMFNVLEHVADIEGTLLKVNKLLSHGALFVFEIPNIFTNIAKLLGSHWYHYQDGHNWFMNIHTIPMLLNKYGFEVDRIVYIPKVVALSKLIDGIFYMTGVYSTYIRRRRIQISSLYSMMNKMTLSVNLKDHMLVIAHKI